MVSWICFRKYAVIAPRVVRPSSLYSVAVAALPGLENNVQVKAALSRDGVEVASSSKEELRPSGTLGHKEFKKRRRKPDFYLFLYEFMEVKQN